MKKSNTDGLVIELNAEMNDWFKGLEESIQKEAIQATAEETVRMLKETSPRGDRKTKKYANTWTYDKSRDTNAAHQFSTVVYNKENYRLTHLLEFGHAKVGKKGGRTRAISHIYPAEKHAIEFLMKKAKEILEGKT